MNKYHEEMQTMLKHSIKNADNNRAFVLLKNDGKEKVLNYNQILSIIEKDKILYVKLTKSQFCAITYSQTKGLV